MDHNKAAQDFLSALQMTYPDDPFLGQGSPMSRKASRVKTNDQFQHLVKVCNQYLKA